MNSTCFTFEGSDRIAKSLLRNVKGVRYLDIGANHPIDNSSTYLFYCEGGEGFAIDGNPIFENLWKIERPKDTYISGIVSDIKKEVLFTSFEDNTMSSADQETTRRYKERGIPYTSIICTAKPLTEYAEFEQLIVNELHLLCVDVEGMDNDVLIGCSLETLKPGVIVVETKNLNLTKANSHPTYDLLTRKGYRLIAKTPLDSVFIDPTKDYLKWIPKTLYC